MEDLNIQLIFSFLEHEEKKGYKRTVIKSKERELLRFYTYTGKSFGKITKDDIVKYLETIEHIKSYNRKLGYIKQFFGYLLEEDHILIDPSLNVETIPYLRGDHSGVFTVDEVKRILETTSTTPFGKRDRAIIELLYSTGIRVSECHSLDIDDVNFRHHEIYIFEGKGGSERIVPVGVEALKSVERYMRVRDSLLDYTKEREALFLSNRGNRISKSSIREMIKRRKKDAGVETFGNCHALRHSCATHLLKNGAPLHLISRILGHENLVATEFYTHIDIEDQKEEKEDE